MAEEKYDIIIIGSGVSGFSAAIYILAHLPKRFVLTRYKGIILFVGYAIFMGLVFVNFDEKLF